MTVKEAFSTKLGSTFCARIPSFSQVNMPNVGVQVLLLVKSEKKSSIFFVHPFDCSRPCSANIALKRFLSRMDPPVVIQLKMPRKVLPAHLALPGSLDAMHGALVDRKRIVVVDDDLAHWAADR